jgi:hypothetical protein
MLRSSYLSLSAILLLSSAILIACFSVVIYYLPFFITAKGTAMRGSSSTFLVEAQENIKKGGKISDEGVLRASF